MNRLIPIVAAIVVIGGGILAWQLTSGDETPEMASVDGEPISIEDVDTSMIVEMTLGDPDAPVTVVEYASFTCPHCASFHDNAFKEFKANYVDTGQVHFIYREVYFDQYGLWAGMVARCGGEDRYFGIVDLIYEQQRSWTRGGTPEEIADNLMTIGKTAGLTNEELEACMSDGDMAQAMVAVYQQNANRDNIRSTPSFLIGGDLATGDMSYQAFSAMIDAKLDS